jgi:hypothetical protein
MEIPGKQYLPYLFSLMKDRNVSIQDMKIVLRSRDISIVQNKTLDLFMKLNVKYNVLSLDFETLSFDLPDISNYLNGEEHKGISLRFAGTKGFKVSYENNTVTLTPITDLVIEVPILRHFVKQVCKRIEIYENGKGKIINSNRGIDFTPDLDLEFV